MAYCITNFRSGIYINSIYSACARPRLGGTQLPNTQQAPYTFWDHDTPPPTSAIHFLGQKEKEHTLNSSIRALHWRPKLNLYLSAMNDIPELDEQILERIRSKTRWTSDGHLEYTGRSSNGSGVTIIQGKIYTVRRVLWAHLNGSIPDKHYVIPDCGYNECVHPDHLSISESVRSETLPDRAVREIRSKYAMGGVTYLDLSIEYGVSESYIGMLVRYDMRVDAGPPPDSEVARKISSMGNVALGFNYNGEAAPSNERNPKYRDDGTLRIPSFSEKAVQEEIISRTTESESGCLFFRGPGGYGEVCIDGQTFRAHRIVQEILNEHIPSGYQVHHKCGEKACVNPDHLEALPPKTHGKRHNKISADERRKLSWEDVKDIRKKYKQNAGVSYNDLSQKYDVSRGYIGRIVRGEVRKNHK